MATREERIDALLREWEIQKEIDKKVKASTADTADLHAQLRVKQQAYHDSIKPLLDERLANRKILRNEE